MFEYLKSKIRNNGITFLQETYSSEKSQNEFKGELYFSHGTTSSCGVMTGFITTKKFSVSKTCKDSKGRILIVEVKIEEVPFILVNLYNANADVEQLKTLCEFDLLLDDFSIDDSKNIFFAGDFNLYFDSTLEASDNSPTLKKSVLQRSYNLYNII